MEKIFDKNTLLQTSIYELRDIARTIGVYLPTTYKKEELIDKIFKIVNGEEMPHIPKSRQGRPPKNLSGKTKMLETFLLSNREERKYDLEAGSSIGVLSEGIIAFLEDSKNPALNTEIFVGYLDIIESLGYGLIRKERDIFKDEKTVYVSSGQIENFNLKTGDLLEVEARVLHKEKPLVLTTVKKINDREFKNSARNKDFKTLSVEMPVREIRFENNDDKISLLNGLKMLPIICGTRNLILIKKGTNFDYFGLIKALNSLVGAKLVCLGLELLPEVTPFMDNIKPCETMYCKLGDDIEKQMRTTHIALERAERLVEEKNDVVLFVDSVDKIVKTENLINDNNINTINKKTMETTKKILGKARSIEVGGSLTEICLMYYKEASEFDNIIIGEIENLFSNIIYV